MKKILFSLTFLIVVFGLSACTNNTQQINGQADDKINNLDKQINPAVLPQGTA